MKKRNVNREGIVGVKVKYKSEGYTFSIPLYREHRFNVISGMVLEYMPAPELVDLALDILSPGNTYDLMVEFKRKLYSKSIFSVFDFEIIDIDLILSNEEKENKGG